MKIIAAGDAIIGRRIQSTFQGYSELTPYIKDADASFFNLETTLNEEGECCSAQQSGGTYLRVTKRVLPDLQKFGFNMTTFNNNHAFDFSLGGFLSTLEALEETDLVHSGAGRNLGEASKPAYLDTDAGRVALISVNSDFTLDMLAGEQTDRVPGRAGINGLRIEKHVNVTETEFNFIKELAEKTNINAARNITAKEGYNSQTLENEEMLGDLKFVLSDKCEYVMEVNRQDVERVKKSIYEAKLQSDYIIVSIHSHQVGGSSKEEPSQFLIDFAHECIDSGANAIIGHGPHLLRPIEVYKDCPIFYSLGDFILELYNVELAPAEFFKKYGLSPDATVHELLKTRSNGFSRGLMTDERMFLSALPLWETENGKLKSLKLIPIELKMTGNKSEIGLPRICPAERILSYLGDMSAPYGVILEKRADGLIDVKW